MEFSFKDIFISRDLKFSVGLESNSEKYYVSVLIPTDNRMSDYEIYYWLPKEYEEFIYSQPIKIFKFVQECMKGFHKDKIINLD